MHPLFSLVLGFSWHDTDAICCHHVPSGIGIDPLEVARSWGSRDGDRWDLRLRYADGVPRRRRRRRVVKLVEFAKCRWFLGRGLPITYIASKLHVSETTIRYWRRLTNTDHAFAELRRRVMLLPEWRREQLMTDLVDARGR